ncbi:MAG: signal peptidase II [Dehalococcoidia bacterium]
MQQAQAGSTSRFRVPTARDAWLLGLSGVVVSLDQLVKWFIRLWVDRGEVPLDLGIVKLVHVTNSGAAFGLFQGAAPLLAATSLVGIAVIVIYLLNPAFAHPLIRVGLALMFGGAIGNLIDRVRAGEVVDYVKFPHYPAFNVADSAITIGVIALIIGTLWEPKTEPNDGRS